MSGRRRLLAFGLSLAIGISGKSLLAQAPAAKKPPPKPEDVTLRTKDGVNLRATFYAGLAKKDSVPIIMVHGWEGQRGEYDALALGLQARGCSIIAPDLRGHGQSTTQKLADGSTRDIEADKLRPSELPEMVLDIEACKSFLMDKNNLGELNINALCVIGADFGSILALRWAALDLTAPPLLTAKQGQDVKALVLLSPMQAFKGLTIREALAVPAVQRELSLMLVAGKSDSKGLAEAKRLNNSLQKFHFEPGNDLEENKKKQDLYLVQAETSLAGTKLLAPALPVMRNIATFIELRLTNKLPEYAWSDRRRATE